MMAEEWRDGLEKSSCFAHADACELLQTAKCPLRTGGVQLNGYSIPIWKDWIAEVSAWMPAKSPRGTILAEEQGRFDPQVLGRFSRGLR